MKYSAENVTWQEAEIKGVRGWFTDVRVDTDTIPGCFTKWELADDCDGIPCRYRRGILVNFYGTFITNQEMPIDDEESVTGYLEEDEWSMGDGGLVIGEITKEVSA